VKPSRAGHFVPAAAAVVYLNLKITDHGVQGLHKNEHFFDFARFRAFVTKRDTRAWEWSIRTSSMQHK